MDHSSLHWLGLGGNKITDQGVRYLATMLEPRPATTIPSLVAAIQVPHTPALFRSNKITANLVTSAANGSSHSLAASSDSEFSFPMATGSAPDITVGTRGLLHDQHPSLPGSHDLTTLASHDPLHAHSSTAAMAAAVVEEKLCSGLESLGLGGNDIGDAGATTMALALMHNQRESLCLTVWLVIFVGLIFVVWDNFMGLYFCCIPTLTT